MKNFASTLKFKVVKNIPSIFIFVFAFLGQSTPGWGQSWSDYYSPSAYSNSGVSNPANVYSSNNSRAEFDLANDIVTYYDFNISTIPADATILGIEVRVEGYRNLFGGRQLEVSLTYNHGTTYTFNTPIPTTKLPGNEGNEAYVTLGANNNSWGHSWTVSELNNTNFGIKLDATISTLSCFVDHLQVRVYYSCNAPAQPSIITGSAAPCQGSSQTYSVTNASGVTYTWAFPSGWTQTGGGTSNSVTATVGSESGNITVTPSNTCGNGTARTLAVTPTTVPAQPSTITGSATPCQGSSQTYSVTNVSGVTYTWAFPSGWTQTGGGTSNSVTATVGSESGNITVTPSNTCGNGTARTLAVTPTTVPAQPSTIIGSATPCQGSSQTYSVTNVSGVTYTWAFPSGWTQTGGGTSNSVTATVGSESGNITVTPSNTCGNGTARTLAVTPTTVPAQPSTIIGSATPCQGSSQTYSVTNVSGVTYTWAFPSGWTQTGGGTSNSVTATVGSESGNITVTPSNTCGNGTARTLAVTPTLVPAQPSTIIGSATPCQGSSQTYSVTNVSGVTYTWAFPSGWTQTGGGTSNSVTATVGSGSGNITVTPSNTCGNGTARTLAVAVNALPTAALSGDATICAGASTNLSVALTGAQPWSITYTDGTTPVTVNDIATSPLLISVIPSSNTTYTLTAVSDFNCTGTSFTGSATITVNPLPTITGSLGICGIGLTTQLTGSGTAAITDPWISATPGVATVDNSGLVTSVSAGTSVITYTDYNGCSSTAVVAVGASNVWIGGEISKDWNVPLNWCGGVVPTTGDVVIPQTPAGNEPIISTAVNITGIDVQSGGILTVSPTGTLTATNVTNAGTLTVTSTGGATITNLTNTGILNLNSDASGTASLIVDTYSNPGGGVENIQLYLSGGGDSWHYMSSPVADLSTDNFAAGNDLAQFVESLAGTASNWQAGWIAWDGWSYLTESPSGSNSFNTLTLGKGYNYWNATSHTFNFSGTLNTTAPSLTLTSTGTGDWSGYNLIGNPFTSGLNIQSMFNDAGWPIEINEAVYYTSNGLYYVYGNDVAVPSTTQSQIPPMQGFFVRATSGGTYTLPWVKAHNSGPRFKGEKSSIPLVRLSISANGKSEETVVRFDEKAKMGNDTEFDAPRFIASQNSPSIYTSLNGTDYTINGLPFPETSVEIPVTVKLLTEGSHVITAMEVQELGKYKVSLKDKTTGTTIDLNSGKEYSFSAPAGLINDRFILVITYLSTDIENPLAAETPFNIYHGFDLINIQPLADEWDGESGSVRIMDLSGKPVRVEPNAVFNKNILIQLPAPDKAGLYFVEIKSGMMKFTGKVVVK